MKLIKFAYQSDKFIFWSLLLLSLFFVIFIYKEISQPQLVAWDEAGYIWQSYVVRSALTNQWISGLWEVSKDQVLYPFFQSWYLTFVSLFLGFSINSIRLASAILFIPATLLIWILSKTLISGRKEVQFIPLILFLSSPMMVYYFSTAMKEGLGTVLSLLTIYLYFLARVKGISFFYFLTSVSLFILFLTKYNYAVLVFVPLAIEASIELLNLKQTKQNLRFICWLFFPFALGFIWWVFISHNIIEALWFVLRNNFQENLNQTDTLGHLLYYPQELAYSYLLHPLMSILVVTGLVWSMKNWRLFYIRVLAMFFFLNLFLGINHMSNNQARFIFTPIPALFLLTGIGLNFFIQDLSTSLLIKKYIKRVNLKILSLILISTGVLFIGSQLQGFSTRIRSVGSHQVGSAIFYETDYSPNYRFDFNLSTWPQKTPTQDKIAGQTINDVFEYAFTQADLSSTLFLVGQLNELSPGLFDLKLALKRKERGIYFIDRNKFSYIVVQLQPGSRFANADYNLHYPKDLVKEVLQDQSLAVVSQETFPYLGMTVTILIGPPLQK